MRKLVNEVLNNLHPYIPYSEDAENLVLGTGAHESAGFEYTTQIGGGPALGKWQMEPFTFEDIKENVLRYHPDLAIKILHLSGVKSLVAKDLITNDVLAICMCRVQYYRQKEAIPHTLQGYAEYWKKYYNTEKGKGTVQQFIDDYKFYVMGKSQM